MTVCIAAIAEGTVLVGVSDRMLSTEDMEFETKQAKVWGFSNSIVALLAGDTEIQGELIRQVDNIVKSWIQQDKSTWVNVKDVATLYCQKYRELRRARAEESILYPLGLDLQSFLANQHQLQGDLLSRVADELIQYQFPEEKNSRLEAIFMGMDNDGPTSEKGEKLNYAKIYVAESDRLSFRSTIGFAAIGSGRAHAESQFMVSGHWPKKSLNETVFLAYSAKKRAEAAPGVGKETDIISLGPTLGSLVKVDEKFVKELDSIYKKSQRPAVRSDSVAQKETGVLIEKIRADIKEKRAVKTTDKSDSNQKTEELEGGK